jgi:hypothetical protein
MELRISAELVNTDAAPFDIGAILGQPSKALGEVVMRAKRSSTITADPALAQSDQFAVMRQRLASMVDDVRTDLDTQLETAEGFPEPEDA